VKRSFFGVFLLCVSSAAYANSAWPGLYLFVEGIYVWWVIAIGLAIEWLAIKWLFRLPSIRTIAVDIAANATSALFGVAVLLVPPLIHRIFYAVVPTLVLAILVNLIVETAVMRFGFKLPITKRATAVILAANTVTVLLALIPMSRYMKRLP
jgi:hypothetical protein